MRPSREPVRIQPLSLSLGYVTANIMPRMRQCPICGAPVRGHHDEGLSEPDGLVTRTRPSKRRTFTFACGHQAVSNADDPDN